MNLILAALNIISLVYCSSTAIYEITSTGEEAARVGRLMVPIFFQNGYEKVLPEGHTGTFDKTSGTLTSRVLS